MKRFMAPGDPRQYGEWIVGVVDLANYHESALRAALEDIIAATSDIKRFLQLPGQGRRSEASHYTLRFSNAGALTPLEHERDVWPRMVLVPELRPLIARYVEQANGEEESWQDEMHPRASFAVAELALVESKWCSLLGRLLFTWDMAHETFQEGLIDQLFERHGLDEHTLELLACRTCADGQSSSEQIAAALYDHGFREKIDLDAFARQCAVVGPRSGCLELGLHYFAMIYANGEESEYDACWAAYRRAGIDELIEGFDEGESLAFVERRSPRESGHWNSSFADTTVDSFDVESLIPLVP